MDILIQNLQYSSTPIQALAVTVGGLIGVFATLTAFFLVMVIANKAGSRKAKAKAE
jgi:hypothetical protein